MRYHPCQLTHSLALQQSPAALLPMVGPDRRAGRSCDKVRPKQDDIGPAMRRRRHCGKCPRGGLKRPQPIIKIQMYTYEINAKIFGNLTILFSKLKSKSHYCTKVGLSVKTNVC